MTVVRIAAMLVLPLQFGDMRTNLRRTIETPVVIAWVCLLACPHSHLRSIRRRK